MDRDLYDIRVEQQDYDAWVDSHKPFHWFVEFPAIFNQGGFDIIIGNPPYINAKLVNIYRWQGYETQNLPDIYALCVERSLYLLSKQSRYTMILPLSFHFSSQFHTARKMATRLLPNRWVSSYSKRPDSLFRTELNGHVIFVGSNNLKDSCLYTTRFYRWIKNFRPFLFSNLSYAVLPKSFHDRMGVWLKAGSASEVQILDRLLSTDNDIKSLVNKKGNHNLYYKKAVSNYLSLFLTIPSAFDKDGNSVPNKVGVIRFTEERIRDIAFAYSISKLALLWYSIIGDGYHLNSGWIYSIPIPASNYIDERLILLVPKIDELLKETLGFKKNKDIFVGNYDTRKIRHMTDQIDHLILEEFGLKDHWDKLQLFYAIFTKQSTDRVMLIPNPKFD